MNYDYSKPEIEILDLHLEHDLLGLSDGAPIDPPSWGKDLFDYE